MSYIANRNLYLAADKKTVVEEDDPRQAWVLVAKGGTLSDEDAKKYGLSNKAETEAKAQAALREDGPTLRQWVDAGYPPDKYPPQGYKAKTSPDDDDVRREHAAKLEAAKVEPPKTDTTGNVSGFVKTEEPPKTMGTVSPGASSPETPPAEPTRPEATDAASPNTQ